MNKLTSVQRSYLTRCSHQLKPTVMVGQQGFTEGIVKATEEALALRELIKVKFISNKEIKKEISADLAEAVDASLVRVIGNIAILYKQAEKKDDRNYHLPK